jgi:hypothetical protein
LVKFARSAHFVVTKYVWKTRFLPVERRFTTSGKDLVGVVAIVDPPVHQGGRERREGKGKGCVRRGLETRGGGEEVEKEGPGKGKGMVVGT